MKYLYSVRFGRFHASVSLTERKKEGERDISVYTHAHAEGQEVQRFQKFVLVVPLSHTNSEELAVMVKQLNALVADRAVEGPGRAVDAASLAKFVDADLPEFHHSHRHFCKNLIAPAGKRKENVSCGFLQVHAPHTHSGRKEGHTVVREGYLSQITASGPASI